MKKKVAKLILLLATMSTVLTGCGIVVEPEGEAEATVKEESKKKYLAGDPVEINIRPQDDFYGYVNAETLWNLEVPYGESSAGGFDDAQESVVDALIEIIEDLDSSDEVYEKESSERIILDFYQLCKDKKVTDKKVFDEVFTKIDNVKTIEELGDVLGELSLKYGCDSLLQVAVLENPFKPDEYVVVLVGADTFGSNLKGIHEKESNVKTFRDGLSELIQGYGFDYDTSCEKADAITYLWLDIAGETNFDLQEEYDFITNAKPYTMDEIKALYSNIDAEKWFGSMGFTKDVLSKVDCVYVVDENQAKMVNTLLVEDNLEAWKDYAKCVFLHQYAAFVPQEYSKMDIDMDYKDLENPDFVYDLIMQSCYDELSDLYYEKYYTEEYDAYMQKMKKDIEEAYLQMIMEADWLSDDGKEAMALKFKGIHFYFGGEGRSEKRNAGREIKENLLMTSIYEHGRMRKNTIDKIGTTVDYSVWSMGAQEINAYYKPEANSIYITRGIMNAPFFDIHGDYYSNLGGLGSVICHELSHGFDDSGIRYDKDGKFNPAWVSEEDNEAFQKIVKATEEYYNQYTLLEVYHVKGDKTVGENLADIGSMQCILSLAHNKEEYEKIFENYARIWCTLYQNRYLMNYLEKDNHSPGLVRVNAVLSCFKEFYETYGVKEGDGMYQEPEERINRW